jgi:hypothetical protein
MLGLASFDRCRGRKRHEEAVMRKLGAAALGLAVLLSMAMVPAESPAQSRSKAAPAPKGKQKRQRKKQGCNCENEFKTCPGKPGKNTALCVGVFTDCVRANCLPKGRNGQPGKKDIKACRARLKRVKPIADKGLLRERLQALRACKKAKNKKACRTMVSRFYNDSKRALAILSKPNLACRH